MAADPHDAAVTGAANLTHLLPRAAAGDAAAASAAFAQVYEQLKRIAQQRMASERRDHTLQATALVHEAYLRLLGNQAVVWSGRAQFFVLASEAIRRILIDHARKRKAAKRAVRPLSLSGAADLASDEKIDEVMSLEDSISRLEKEDARAARVVRLRFYAGLSIDDTADALGLNPRTVKRDWEFARAWLASDLESHAP